MRYWRRSLAVAALLAMLLPTGALAQGSGNPVNQTSNPLSPFAPAPAPSPTTTAPVTTASTSTSGGGLTSGDAVLIAVGAVVVLGGISLFIWRDARKRAPVRHRPAPATAGGPGSRQRQKSRKLSPAERRRRKRGRAR